MTNTRRWFGLVLGRCLGGGGGLCLKKEWGGHYRVGNASNFCLSVHWLPSGIAFMIGGRRVQVSFPSTLDMYEFCTPSLQAVLKVWYYGSATLECTNYRYGTTVVQHSSVPTLLFASAVNIICN